MIPIGAALSAGVPCAVLRLGGLDMVRIVEKMHMCIVILPSANSRASQSTHLQDNPYAQAVASYGFSAFLVSKYLRAY